MDRRTSGYPGDIPLVFQENSYSPVVRLVEAIHWSTSTTSNLEKFNQEVKQRARVVRIIPNRRRWFRLISALAMEKSAEWLTGSRYLRMAQTGRVEQPKKEDVL
jgi:transposase-like protein